MTQEVGGTCAVTQDIHNSDNEDYNASVNTFIAPAIVVNQVALNQQSLVFCFLHRHFQVGGGVVVPSKSQNVYIEKFQTQMHFLLGCKYFLVNFY